MTGGVLGIFCSHAYAHNTYIAKESLPRALKGSDMVIYSIFQSLQSLGVEVHIRPVLEYKGSYHTTNPDLGITEDPEYKKYDDGVVIGTQLHEFGTTYGGDASQSEDEVRDLMLLLLIHFSRGARGCSTIS